MGTDAQGWIEFRPPWSPEAWNAVIRIGPLVDRHYDMFGLLFGVRNFAQFPPVAAGRGIPGDLSNRARDEYLAMETISASWVLWSEIDSVDWDLAATDGRPHRYERQPDGSLAMTGKASPVGRFEPPQDLIREAGATWERDGDVFRIERITRREVLDGSPTWKLIFDLMARLAADHGSDNVRLVAWFDQ